MKYLTIGTLATIAGALAIPAAVMLSGGTFGQRCSAVYDSISIEWNECVERLSDGDRMSEIMRDLEKDQGPVAGSVPALD